MDNLRRGAQLMCVLWFVDNCGLENRAKNYVWECIGFKEHCHTWVIDAPRGSLNQGHRGLIPPKLYSALGLRFEMICEDAA